MKLIPETDSIIITHHECDTVSEKTTEKNPPNFMWERNPRKYNPTEINPHLTVKKLRLSDPYQDRNLNLIWRFISLKVYFVQEQDGGGEMKRNHLAMPQRPVGLAMKLSQPNMALSYPLNYDKTCL